MIILTILDFNSSISKPLALIEVDILAVIIPWLK